MCRILKVNVCNVAFPGKLRLVQLIMVYKRAKHIVYQNNN